MKLVFIIGSGADTLCQLSADRQFPAFAGGCGSADSGAFWVIME